jgi:DNA replication and repair protein RecF
MKGGLRDSLFNLEKTRMHLEAVHLTSYRNYAELSCTLAPALNVLVGPNAQGKTNLLEAIYLLATTKSMRGSRDQDLVRWEAERTTVTGYARRTRRNDITLEIAIGRNEPKSMRINGARQPRVMDFVGQFNAVVFSTQDVEVVRGEPALRRRFLDLEISQVSPSYCHALAYYRRTIEQRNLLLRAMREGRGGGLADSLEAWDEQLLNHGSRIVERRAHFLRDLEEHARPIHAQLTDNGEYLGLAYRSSFPLPEKQTTDTIREAFAEALVAARGEELRRGVSTVGPHRDDVIFLINGHETRIYGSQGQQRTAALSVKLAEIHLIRDQVGEPPVCLLDDVMSELDDMRRSHLFDVTLDTCQTILTCTHTRSLPEKALRSARILQVHAGTIQAEK